MSTDGNGKIGCWRLHAVVAAAALCMVLTQLPSAANALTSHPGAAGPWNPTEVQLPANAGTNPGVTFGAVSCHSAGSCVGVGEYNDTAGYQNGVIDALSGGAWTATIAPEPAGAGTDAENEQNAHLYGVSCASSGSCVSVGTYRDASGFNHGLIETLSGGTWTATRAPEPAGSALQSAYLESVSCPSAGACVAVGFYIDSGGANYGLIDTLSGGSWTATQAPEPGNSGTDGDGEQNALLYSVSCSLAGSCAATGHYNATTGVVFGLIDTLSGGNWTDIEAPLPANAGSNPIVALSSVSCPSAGSCAAVGQYKDTGGFYYGLIETLSGGAWAATAAPEPANAGTEGTGTEEADLDSVACHSAGSCVTVGFYNDTSGYQFGLIDSLTGGTWTATEAPEPANGNVGYADLYGVSCATNTSCVTVGDYYDASFLYNGLIDTLSGGAWSATAAPEPANAGTDADSHQHAVLNAVSCPSATSCGAVGDYDDTSGSQQGLLEVYSSTVPTVTGLNPTSGPTAGGNTVTINGTNFTGATSVVFGATAATNLAVATSTQITVTAPHHGAGTVNVRVTTPGGESATNSADIYTYAAKPTVTGLNPTGGPPAGGNTVTINGTNFTGATSVVFGTNAASNLDVFSSTEIIVTAPNHRAATVNVRVTTPGGESATNSADTYTYT
jgi:IPT/TIG domain